MKIAVLFSNYMYSYITNFLDDCEKNSISVDFFKFAHDKVSFNVKANNIYILNSKWKSKNFNTVKQIEDEIKNLVNINDYDLFLSDTMGLSFNNACNFFHGHTTLYKINHTSNGILNLILKLSHLKLIKTEAQYYKNTKFCIVGSKEMAIDYIQNCNISKEKIKIIFPGKDNIIQGSEQIKKSNDKYIFGAVTCGFQLKGGYTIISAIKKLKKFLSKNNIYFKLIHPTYNKQWLLKLYIKFLRIDKYIEFLPYQENINDFYNSIDCLICASNAEAFGRVVTEAMISEIPVIVGSNVGASDIIKDKINGYIYIYDKNKSNNLAQTIEFVYKNRFNSKIVIENALTTAKSISWENFSNKLFDSIIEYSKI